MRRFIILLIAAAMLFVSCSPKAEEVKEPTAEEWLTSFYNTQFGAYVIAEGIDVEKGKAVTLDKDTNGEDVKDAIENFLSQYSKTGEKYVVSSITALSGTITKTENDVNLDDFKVEFEYEYQKLKEGSTSDYEKVGDTKKGIVAGSVTTETKPGNEATYVIMSMYNISLNFNYYDVANKKELPDLSSGVLLRYKAIEATLKVSAEETEPIVLKYDGVELSAAELAKVKEEISKKS